jgi:hypothetical protein
MIEPEDMPNGLYALEIDNAKYFGLRIRFSNETETVGTEEDGSPTYFAQIDGKNRLAIFQGPARDLQTWLSGYQWGQH